MSSHGEGHLSQGFTLLEIIVALAIAGLLLLAVHGLFGVAIEQARRIERARSEFDRRENAIRWLAEAFASADVGRVEPGPFIGNPGDAEFTCRPLTGSGWHEPTRVTLRVANHELLAGLPDGQAITLADGVGGVELDYLIESGETAPWLRRWASEVNAPLAVRLRLRRLANRNGGPAVVDTTVFVIGRRG